MVTRKSALVVLGVALGVIGTASPRAAVGPARTTYVTFSGRVALPGVALNSGTYIFELANPGNSTDIVSVRDKTRRKTYFTAFTEQVRRPDVSGPMVTLGEARAGNPPPILTWYPDGELTGHRFIYR